MAVTTVPWYYVTQRHLNVQGPYSITAFYIRLTNWIRQWGVMIQIKERWPSTDVKNATKWRHRMNFNDDDDDDSTLRQNHKCQLQNTHSVSSWIRFVSIGTSAPDDGTAPWRSALAGRLGGGDSAGFGWVRVNGSSTDRSLDTKRSRWERKQIRGRIEMQRCM